MDAGALGLTGSGMTKAGVKGLPRVQVAMVERKFDVYACP